ncbi:MAG: hypothetical protein QG656_2763, partial [Candidatus Hydrogenedentes bacterium]|nr:hypothetical protein [Candidatus Hydrogenedentota bacterium]
MIAFFALERGFFLISTRSYTYNGAIRPNRPLGISGTGCDSAYSSNRNKVSATRSPFVSIMRIGSLVVLALVFVVALSAADSIIIDKKVYKG